jgi:dTDP-glucose pyrophosphorylase/CBS domain-containing protein
VSVSEKIWRTTVLPLNSSIKQSIAKLNDTGLQIVLVLDENDILLGTVTDGDIRRGLLRGLTLEDPIESVMRSNSLVVSPEMSRDIVLQLMHANRFRQLPVVDTSHKVLGLHFWDEISSAAERENLMIIMAGGLGTRLRPHTENCPKPMLPVAGKPMLERIIERAKTEGFGRFIISIQYLGHMIEDHFGNGERLGVQISYLKETTPLGTAGALGLLSPRPESPFVVTNGDVLSDIKYGELLDFHARHAAIATMAVSLHEWHHPFGVVHTQGVDIIGFEEKPVARTHINAGIYALSPEALSAMTANKHCDMPTLFEHLKTNGKRTVAYPMHEPWLDVGRPDDLSRANAVNGDNH